MKYYIPTTSLNFNNILSTESLSPKAFYDKRGFGYSRWFTVEENCIEYVTLLYDAPHMFKRPISDIEDHPMLLEIDTDEIFNQLQRGYSIQIEPYISILGRLNLSFSVKKTERLPYHCRIVV